MLIIPAIDLKAGRVVRLRQGDFEQETLYSEEPDDIAMKWQKQGAKMLHVVDLDGAFAGRPKNLDMVKDILRAVDIPIEMGGGLRNEAIVESMLAIGCARVVLGTRAIADEVFIKRLVGKFAERIVVSIDARGDKVVAKGWTSRTTMKALECAKNMESLGVSTIIYTNVLRDGTLEKPELGMIQKILKAVKINVIVAGGVSSLEDIRDLKTLGRKNLAGIIIGKALYEGKIDLVQANKMVGGR